MEINNICYTIGIRRTHALRDQRRQNLNQHIGHNNHQSAANNLQQQNNNSQQQSQQQQSQSQQARTSETSLAIALMGLVILHVVCQLLRVFLACCAVYFISDMIWCYHSLGAFAPPLWSMCAESISSLVIMINASGNSTF